MALGQSGEGEEAVARFFQTLGDGAAFQPPLAQEGAAPDLDLLYRLS